MLTDEKIASIMTSPGRALATMRLRFPLKCAATREEVCRSEDPWTEPELKGWKDDAAPRRSPLQLP
jgi:hypothetical protein